MTSNIKIRIGIIIAVILVCLYGVIGIPKSKDELLANWKKNIHLGLDLSGGTQLVMQVQLQDAFKAAADNTIEALKQELQKDGITPSGDITRNDPNSHRGRRQNRDRRQGRSERQEQPIPQHCQQSVLRLGSHGAQLHRLQADHEAERVL